MATASSLRVAGTVGPIQWLGSLIFTIFFPLWTFCYAIFFVVACLFLPYRGRFELARVWARVILAVLRWTCGLNYRVEGREHLPQGNHVASPPSVPAHSFSQKQVSSTESKPLRTETSATVSPRNTQK